MHPDQTNLLAEAARLDGARVGRLGLPAALNPHELGSDLYKAWYGGWFSEVTKEAA